MRRVQITIALLSFVAAACSEQHAAPTALDGTSALTGRTPAAPTPNVTTTMYDADVAGAPLITGSDDFNGTGHATYTSVNSVTSFINGVGAWQLLLNQQTARTLYLKLNSLGGMPIPDGNYSSSIEAYSQCYDANNVQVSLLSMASGGTNANCSFGLDFGYGGVKYKLVMRPSDAGTGRARVTCNAAVSGSCTSWTIVNADVNHTAILYHFSKSGLVKDGTYKNSYSLTAVVQ